MKRTMLMIAILLTAAVLASCGVTVINHVHSFSEWKTTKEATCGEAGEKERVCTACGAKETGKVEATGDHTFTEWTVTKDATCTEPGEKERVCTVCGTKETGKVEATGGHTFSEWTVTKDATCTEPGEKERVCTVCGAKETETVSGAHEFGGWIVTKEADCSGDGTRTRTCAKCGAKETEAIPATEHNWKEATCVEPKTCTKCGATEGEALGHIGRLGEVCERCGELIDLTIVMPDFPQEAWLNDYNKTRVDSITYRFEGNEIIFTAKTTKVSETRSWSYSGFLYRILDKDGNLIKAGPITSLGLKTGQSTTNEWRFWVQDLGLAPGETTVYLEIKDYHSN